MKCIFREKRAENRTFVMRLWLHKMVKKNKKNTDTGIPNINYIIYGELHSVVCIQG